MPFSAFSSSEASSTTSLRAVARRSFCVTFFSTFLSFTSSSEALFSFFLNAASASSVYSQLIPTTPTFLVRSPATSCWYRFFCRLYSERLSTECSCFSSDGTAADGFASSSNYTSEEDMMATSAVFFFMARIFSFTRSFISSSGDFSSSFSSSFSFSVTFSSSSDFSSFSFSF